jgi:3-deoxy-manno-octulosonate cytidylyltransferase (CMP-KDO synthetase)
MPTIAIIPARLGSTRFPRKVLASQTGRTLIQHVWERARAASSIDRVVIATDDAEVVAAVRGFGGESVMTRADHPNGTSRLAEAAAVLGLSDDAIIVNVQGDEPELDPSLINAAVEVAKTTRAEVTTVASPFAAGESVEDPNIVKVVRRLDGTALYFSRAAIPHVRSGGKAVTPLRHVGIYLYRHAFLKVYAKLGSSPLEQCEMLEQLRVLEHGFSIAVVEHAFFGRGVDTPEQYAEFVARWRKAN